MAKKHEIPPFKEFAIGMAMRSGTILMRNFNDNIKRRRSKKSRNEVVTASDMEVHKFVRFKVQQRFPGHNFESEEGDPINNGSKYTWVIDPLDGTVNYTIGNPFFSTSITLMEGGVPLIGVIYAPYTREMFVVEKNRSARLNERNIRVSQEKRMSNSVMAYAYFTRDKKSRKRAAKLLENFEDECLRMRHLGCTTLALAYVACGRMEASIISPPLRLWDVASGLLLIETAGGRISNFRGEEWEGLHQGVIASNGAIHNKILNIVKEHKI